MIILSCGMMVFGDVPRTGGIQKVVGVVSQLEDLNNFLKGGARCIYHQYWRGHLVDLLLIEHQHKWPR